MDPYRLHTILNELSRLDKDKAKLLDELEAAIQPQHMKVGPGSFDVRFTPPESPHKIPAIKLVREWTNLGLWEAKMAVEAGYVGGLTLKVRDGLMADLARSRAGV